MMISYEFYYLYVIDLLIPPNFYPKVLDRNE